MTCRIFNLASKRPHLHKAYALRVCNNLGFTVGLLINSINFFVGEEQGRFKASDIISDPNRKDCYLATLTIADMISSDSRLYFVTIANDRGETRYGINVRVMCYKNLFILKHTCLPT